MTAKPIPAISDHVAALLRRLLTEQPDDGARYSFPPGRGGSRVANKAADLGLVKQWDAAGKPALRGGHSLTPIVVAVTAPTGLPRLEGFMFTVTTAAGERREVRLQGSGGELGGGCFGAFNDKADPVRRDAYLGRVTQDVLAAARHEAEETGQVRVIDMQVEDYRTRIQPLDVASVDDVRPILYPEGA